MTNQSNLSGHYRFLFILCFALLSVYMMWVFMDKHLGAIDDDKMWFYQMASSTGVTETHLDSFRELNHAYLVRNGALPDWVERAKIRAGIDAYDNYWATSWIVHITHLIVRPANYEDIDRDYPYVAAATMYYGFMAQLALVLILVSVFIFARIEPKMQVAFIMAMLYLALTEWMDMGNNNALISQATFEHGLTYQVKNLFYSFAFPDEVFNIYATPPKSRLVLVTLLAVMCRWGGRPALSYALLMVGALFHQGYGGPIILLILATDIIRRPEIFKNWPVAFFALAGVAMYIARDGIFRQALDVIPHMFLVAGIAVFVIALAAVYICRRPFLKLQSFIIDRINRLCNNREILVDLFIIGMLWAITLILFIPLSLISSPEGSQYFWGLIHGRILGIILPFFYTGIFYALLDWLYNRYGLMPVLRVCLAVYAVALAAFWVHGFSQFRAPSHVYQSLQSDIVSLDNELDDPDYDRLRQEFHHVAKGEHGEALIYYAYAKSLETGRDYYTPLLIGDGAE